MPMILESRFKHRIDILESYSDLPLLPLNIGQINQVFMNLIINAIDAIADRGEIRIKTFIEGQTIIISIQDTGKGIEPENLDKIFDPFFTIKTGGTGLGLSRCTIPKSTHNCTLRRKSKHSWRRQRCQDV